MANVINGCIESQLNQLKLIHVGWFRLKAKPSLDSFKFSILKKVSICFEALPTARALRTNRRAMPFGQMLFSQVTLYSNRCIKALKVH